MLSYNIISFGKSSEKWIQDGWNKYRKRINNVKINLIEIPFFESDTCNTLENKINEKIKKNSFTIALHENGELLNNLELSDKIIKLHQQYSNLNFLIGGPNGLPENILNKTYQLSLSPLTFPHMIVRVILIEQLYRTHCIFRNHPYHK